MRIYQLISIKLSRQSCQEVEHAAEQERLTHLQPLLYLSSWKNKPICITLSFNLFRQKSERELLSLSPTNNKSISHLKLCALSLSKKSFILKVYHLMFLWWLTSDILLTPTLPAGNNDNTQNWYWYRYRYPISRLNKMYNGCCHCRASLKRHGCSRICLKWSDSWFSPYYVIRSFMNGIKEVVGLALQNPKVQLHSTLTHHTAKGTCTQNRTEHRSILHFKRAPNISAQPTSTPTITIHSI